MSREKAQERILFSALPDRAVSDARLRTKPLYWSVLAVIAKHDRMSLIRGGAGCFVEQRRLAEIIDCNVSRFSDAVGKLEDWGYLKVEKRGRGRSYRVIYETAEGADTLPHGKVSNADDEPDTLPHGKVSCPVTCPVTVPVMSRECPVTVSEAASADAASGEALRASETEILPPPGTHTETGRHTLPHGKVSGADTLPSSKQIVTTLCRPNSQISDFHRKSEQQYILLSRRYSVETGINCAEAPLNIIPRSGATTRSSLVERAEAAQEGSIDPVGTRLQAIADQLGRGRIKITQSLVEELEEYCHQETGDQQPNATQAADLLARVRAAKTQADDNVRRLADEIAAADAVQKGTIRATWEGLDSSDQSALAARHGLTRTEVAEMLAGRLELPIGKVIAIRSSCAALQAQVADRSASESRSASA